VLTDTQADTQIHKSENSIFLADIISLPVPLEHYWLLSSGEGEWEDNEGQMGDLSHYLK